MTDDRSLNSNSSNGNETRDDVATLVRLAGNRPPVPQERFDRAKAAARASWQRQHRQRSRRRYAAVAVAAAAMVVLAIALRVVPDGAVPASEVAFRVEAIQGQAWIGQRELGVGDVIDGPAELATSAEGRLAVRLTSGHSLRLDRGSRTRLAGPNSIELDRGAIYVDSGLQAASEEDAPGLTVRTSFGDVDEVGTQFEVRLGERNLRVSLREGSVVLTGGGQVYPVDVGTELTLSADGSTIVRELPAVAPEWDWAKGIAPMLDLEGRTAREFLDWIAREQGWTLAFADEAVARSAEATVLAGASRNLSLETALETVLPTCRMGHRVLDGVLIVASD